MKNYLLLLAAAVSFTFASCDTEEDTAPTRTELLTGKKWIVTGDTDTEDTTGVIDNNYLEMDSCELDNSTTFETGGTIIYDEEAVVCDGQDKITRGNWEFTNNEYSLIMRGTHDIIGNYMFIYDIKELTKNRLVLKRQYNTGSGDRTQVITFATK